jgi:hypothetical protein
MTATYEAMVTMATATAHLLTAMASWRRWRLTFGNSDARLLTHDATVMGDGGQTATVTQMAMRLAYFDGDGAMQMATLRLTAMATYDGDGGGHWRQRRSG